MTDAVALEPSTELVIEAAVLAVHIDHPVYDCVYLACAEAAAAPLVTADERLAQRAREAYPAVDVWNIGETEIAQRIATAATALVIKHDTVQRAIDAYDAFRRTADSVIETVQRSPAAFGYSHRKTRTPTSKLQRTGNWSSLLPASRSTNEST